MASSLAWKTVVGIELHAQIKSARKLFSGAPVTFAAQPNSQVSFVDAALPGTLPVLNPECVDHAIRTGLALNCDINRVSRFERKHYFYCDMPQGYQITQRLHPVASDGFVELQNPSSSSSLAAGGGGKQSSAAPPSESGLSEDPEAPPPLRVRVDRIQIEQDSGKNIHDSYSGATMVDLNRAGVGLMEIVFAPDLNSGKDTADVVRKVQLLLRHLGACDANMDEGQLRCDVNVSVTPLPPSAGEWGQAGGEQAASEFDSLAAVAGTRCEVKNLNSLRSIQDAVDYESARQIAHLLDTRTAVPQETRTFDAVAGTTAKMRSKEGDVDYRYMPEPDVPPLVLPPTLVDSVRDAMPELPEATVARLTGAVLEDGAAAEEEEEGLGDRLTEQEADVLVHAVGGAAAVRYFDAVLAAVPLQLSQGGNTAADVNVAKLAWNWITGELFQRLNDAHISIGASPASPDQLASIIVAMQTKQLSPTSSKAMMDTLFDVEETRLAKDVIESDPAKWHVIGDESAVRELCLQVLDSNPKQLDQHVTGKKRNLLGFFVGQVMKLSKGSADARVVKETMMDMLEKRTQEEAGGGN